MPKPRRRLLGWAIAGSLCTCHLGGAADAQGQRKQSAKPMARAGAMTPLPPRRPADLKPRPISDDAATSGKPTADTSTPPPDKPAAPSACMAMFEERGGIALSPVSDSGSGSCAIEEPVTFQSVAMPDGSKIELDSVVTVRCSFALEIASWIRDDMTAITTRENGKLAKLVGVGGHACRPRNGMAGAPISEHASGNALDLSGLRLQDGRTIGLAGKDGATRSLREAIQKSACARFRTVLGPGSDNSHKDHLHLDMRQRPRDFRMCQWSVE